MKATTSQLKALVQARLLTRQDIAALLGISRQAVDQKVEQGVLPPPIHTLGSVSVWDGDEVFMHIGQRR